MKIVVACDSFKGCMTSKEANEAIKRGILKSNDKHTVIRPLLFTQLPYTCCMAA